MSRDEYDAEPVPGLPERLPAGERMLWQGAPAWWPLARGAFHVRAVGAYFALLAAWRVASVHADGGDLAAAATAGALPLALAVPALGILCLIAWLMARATRYTITDRRVVMRFGVALPMAVNVPFSVIESASLKRLRDGSGDVALCPDRTQRPSYLLLWPNARPWRFARVEPSLRAVPDAAAVAERLAGALAAFHADARHPAHAPGADVAPMRPAAKPAREPAPRSARPLAAAS